MEKLSDLVDEGLLKDLRQGKTRYFKTISQTRILKKLLVKEE